MSGNAAIWKRKIRRNRRPRLRELDRSADRINSNPPFHGKSASTGKAGQLKKTKPRRGRAAKPLCCDFSVLAEKWLSSIPGTVKESTFTRYSRIVKIYGYIKLEVVFRTISF